MAVISDDNPVRRHFFLSGEIVSILVSLIALPTIALFGCQRHANARRRNYTVALFLCLLCYATDFIFIFTVTVLVHSRIPPSDSLCNAMMIICLVVHNIAKSAEFAFLIERAYIISWPVLPRLRTPEYLISSICIACSYAAVSGIAIKHRVAYLLSGESCIIGMKMYSLMPMLGVEVAAQLYLTIRFLLPLLCVHRDGSGLLVPLRKVVVRSSVGCATTMLVDVAVKVSLTLFNGEPVWLCYLTCKIEAFIGAIVIHWITQPVLTKAPEGQEKGQPALGIGFDQSKYRSETQSTNNESAAWREEVLVRKVLAFPNAYRPHHGDESDIRPC